MVGIFDDFLQAGASPLEVLRLHLPTLRIGNAALKPNETRTVGDHELLWSTHLVSRVEPRTAKTCLKDRIEPLPPLA